MARAAGGRADAVLAIANTFRQHGFEGASLSVISAETGLGKGSLYNFFPGGKDEMGAAVLDEVGAWFRQNIYAPLEADGDPAAQVAAMFAASREYFASRQLVCLFGAFALSQERERFADAIRDYFAQWISALAGVLARAGRPEPEARELAADAVAGIQGALVVSRALGDPAEFEASLARLERRLADA